MFKTGPLFYANLNATEDIVINQGGTDSGKTHAIVQVLLRFCTEKAPASDPIISIVSKSIPDSRKGAYRMAKALINENDHIRAFISSWNETDRTIYFKTGWVMEFVSYQDEQTAKQGKRQYSFFNEANGIPYNIFWQIAKRTRIRTFIDYNPTALFWSHEMLLEKPDRENDLNATVKYIRSDHRHNPFLSQKDHDKTENIKDPELWRVYARGLTGNLTGIIFPDWREAEFPNHDYIFYGLDIGYTNDPCALVKMCRIGQNLFIDELLYETAISPRQILQVLNANGYSGENVYCDHSPEYIRELRLNEVMALPGRKGPGSIMAGIMKLKEYNVFYTPRSKGLKEELKRYMWIVDKDTGKPTNTPVDEYNHTIDATRLAAMSHFWHSQNT